MEQPTQDNKSLNAENMSYYSPFLGNTDLEEQVQEIYKLNICSQERDKKLLDLLLKGNYQYQFSPFCSLHALERIYHIKHLYEIPDTIRLILAGFISSEIYTDTNMRLFLTLIETYKLMPELFINICTTLHVHFVLKQNTSFQDTKNNCF